MNKRKVGRKIRPVRTTKIKLKKTKNNEGLLEQDAQKLKKIY